ncbi:MAG: hypothetical protein QNJ90_07950 [Planctomycetota bacterium]|nr:hypothetical protein [Planctomycetota bacterium]
MRTAFLLCIGLLLTGCGPTDDPGTAQTWIARADEAFAEGDKLAQDPAALSDAVAAWRRAGSDYVRAFRLEDPTPERAEARALLAFRIGRAWSKAARESADEPRRGAHGDRALFWFAHARRLEPGLRQAWYERALLFDSDIADVADGVRAREAYEKYVAAVEAAGDVPDGERERVKRARERLEVLGGGD